MDEILKEICLISNSSLELARVIILEQNIDAVQKQFFYKGWLQL